MNWSPAAYVFGPGLVADRADGPVELVPFVGDDGLGTVAGYALFVDRRFVARLAGSLDSARAEAERPAPTTPRSSVPDRPSVPARAGTLAPAFD